MSAEWSFDAVEDDDFCKNSGIPGFVFASLLFLDPYLLDVETVGRWALC